MDTSFVKTESVRTLLDKAAGLNQPSGDSPEGDRPRHRRGWCGDHRRGTISARTSSGAPSTSCRRSAPEFGLLVPRTGLEHFLDLFMDAKDAEAGRSGGTPRTIEGPLYVAGAPLEEGDVNLTKDPDDTRQPLHEGDA